uniref:LD06106p n=1 Tax=Drosophila melanogaster TaxID=7227 RepID=Q8SZI5_DROME|nr:LD06106p [Drosophila melanogaster]
MQCSRFSKICSNLYRNRTKAPRFSPPISSTLHRPRRRNYRPCPITITSHFNSSSSNSCCCPTTSAMRCSSSSSNNISNSSSKGRGNSARRRE